MKYSLDNERQKDMASYYTISLAISQSRKFSLGEWRYWVTWKVIYF